MSNDNNVLTPNHPLLQDGLNDGFRAPHLGWVGTHRETEVSAEYFEGGSTVFSNFWVGPVDQAKAFAQALVDDFAVWLPSMEPEEESAEFIPIISVCYWEGASSGLGLVATQSVTPDFMIDCVPESFTAFERFGETMRQVAFDGNDNYPAALIDELPYLKCAREEATHILAIVLSVAEEGQQENVQTSFDRCFPTVVARPSL